VCAPLLGDEMIADSYDMKLIDDVAYEVECKVQLTSIIFCKLHTFRTNWYFVVLNTVVCAVSQELWQVECVAYGHVLPMASPACQFFLHFFCLFLFFMYVCWSDGHGQGWRG